MKTSKSKKTLTMVSSFFNKKNTLVRAISATVLGIAFIFFHNYIGKGFILIFGVALFVYAGYDIFKTLKPVLWPEKKEVEENETSEPAEPAEPVEPAEPSAEAGTDGNEKKVKFTEILKMISVSDYLYILVGLVFMIFPGFLMGILVALFGVILIIMACLQLKLCLSYRELLEEFNTVLMWVCLAVPIIWIILAIIIIINPFEQTSGVILFTGITILLFGLVEIARIIFFKQFADETEDESDDDPELLEE